MNNFFRNLVNKFSHGGWRMKLLGKSESFDYMTNFREEGKTKNVDNSFKKWIEGEAWLMFPENSAKPKSKK